MVCSMRASSLRAARTTEHRTFCSPGSAGKSPRAGKRRTHQFPARGSFTGTSSGLPSRRMLNVILSPTL